MWARHHLIQHNPWWLQVSRKPDIRASKAITEEGERYAEEVLKDLALNEDLYIPKKPAKYGWFLGTQVSRKLDTRTLEEKR
jgi:hypothetical protein